MCQTHLHHILSPHCAVAAVAAGAAAATDTATLPHNNASHRARGAWSEEKSPFWRRKPSTTRQTQRNVYILYAICTQTFTQKERQRQRDVFIPAQPRDGCYGNFSTYPCQLNVGHIVKVLFVCVCVGCAHAYTLAAGIAAPVRLCIRVRVFVLVLSVCVIPVRCEMSVCTCTFSPVDDDAGCLNTSAGHIVMFHICAKRWSISILFKNMRDCVCHSESVCVFVLRILVKSHFIAVTIKYI